MTRALSIAELAAMAAATEDQTETKSGGFEREVPPAGKTVGRFIEYIEIGKRPGGQYLGKAKPDAHKVRITFELLTPVHIREYEDNGVKKERANRISITIKKSFSEKGKFKKLFNKMTYGRDGIKHMAMMLGEAFVLGIFHNVEEKDGQKVTYINLNPKDSDYVVEAPYIEDPLTSAKTPIVIREPISPLRIFLWDNPTKETWDALFIDGTHTVKDEKGVESEVSNNWLQEMMFTALDYKGSALEALLNDVADLPASEEEAEKPAEQPAESAPAEQDKAAPAGGSNEALAALGLM